MSDLNKRVLQGNDEDLQDKREKRVIVDDQLLDLVPGDIDPALGIDPKQDQHRQVEDVNVGTGEEVAEGEVEGPEEGAQVQIQEHDGDEDHVNHVHESLLFDHHPSDDLNYPSTGQISNAFQKKQLTRLSEILKDLNRQLPQRIRNEQAAALKRINKAETTIDALRRENLALKDKLKSERSNLVLMKREQNQIEKAHQSELGRLQSIIEDARSLENQYSFKIEELKQNQKLEEDSQISNLQLRNQLSQVLTGLNCYQLEEDEESLYFSIKQMAIFAEFHYQLVISKNDDSGEVLFIPDWEKPNDYEGDWEHNVETLKSLLPEYLHSDLVFNSDTLHSFYSKISKCLKKEEKVNES